MRFYKFLILIIVALGFSFGSASCKKDSEPKKEDNLEQTLTLDSESATLHVGEKILLKPGFGSTAIPKRTYQWSVDNPEVVSVAVNKDYSATITAKKKGTAKVSLSSKDGVLTVVCNISVEDAIGDGVIKILAIGNSFSQDAIETYLYELADAEGLKVVIGNLYIGGASLDLHWKNANGNLAAYDYRKITQNGNKTDTKNTSIATALADENWDYISFQQASPNSGQYNTFTTPLPLLFNYVKQRAINPSVKYILHQTWAYAQNSTHAGFANYGKNQVTMYNAIVDAVGKAKDLIGADLIIPAGTAIQNGRTSIVGDNFNRDGYHLDVNIGRYTAACTWFEEITGKAAIGNAYKPTTLSAYEAEIAQHAAHFAVLKPNEVTEMVDYQDFGNFDPLTAPVFIGFGYDAAVAGWNGLLGASNFRVGSAIYNMTDKNGKETGISLRVTEGFSARNAAGEKVTSTELNLPESVSSNSYYGNAGAPWRDLEIKQSAVKLSGLEKGKNYNFCFFSSRSKVTANENRETKYIVKGKNEVIARLDAANNKSEITCANTVQADDEGEITITITAGENNNNVNGFFYINAMRVSPAN